MEIEDEGGVQKRAKKGQWEINKTCTFVSNEQKLVTICPSNDTRPNNNSSTKQKHKRHLV